jgi:hypothetical protein
MLRKLAGIRGSHRGIDGLISLELDIVATSHLEPTPSLMAEVAGRG